MSGWWETSSPHPMKPEESKPPAFTTGAWLAIAVHLLTIAGFIWAAATQYGILETRVEVNEHSTAQQTLALQALALQGVATQRELTAEIHGLRADLMSTQAVINERARRAELQTVRNGATLRQQAQRQDGLNDRQDQLDEQQTADRETTGAKQHPRSLRNLLIG